MGCLELSGVSYRYEGAAEYAIKNISIVFERSKVYAIVGQSGAGKSTLLSLISGLDTCKEGKIMYNGTDLTSIDRDWYRSVCVGVIFQNYNLLINSTAVYNLTLSMRISESNLKTPHSATFHKTKAAAPPPVPATSHILRPDAPSSYIPGPVPPAPVSNHILSSMPPAPASNHIPRPAPTVAGNNRRKYVKRRAEIDYAYDLLDKVGIDRETADRKILHLSGGEQQRAGIARALSHNPDVVIADEPTGNLAAETEKAVLDILVRLAHDDGKCVIIVTHSDIVSSAADEVIGIGAGRLLA
jgi:ABC-type lipoprotein export system ATPase subunit